MFLLDTNTISELRRTATRRADPRVVAWATRARAEEFYLSAITIHELEIGALRAEHKDPRKGAVLRRWLAEYVLKNFHQRILPIDVPIALRSAQLQMNRTRQIPDALIAATALVHGFSVVTRNVSDFADTGVNVINPWLAPS